MSNPFAKRFDFLKMCDELLGPARTLSHCPQCSQAISNPALGCSRCGDTATQIIGASTPTDAVTSAALESAQAVIVVKRYLDALDGQPSDDPTLRRIRRSTHAPLHDALDVAINKIVAGQTPQQ